MKSAFRITLAQINPTIGDIDGNIALMRAAAAKAQAEEARMVVFPELSLTGYYPGDLLDEQAFLVRVAAGVEAVREATRATPGLHWVLGAPLPHGGPGKALQNCLLVVVDGEIRLRYAKQLLPTYNIFDEHRHFEPGPDVACVLRIDGMQIGFLICEDGWNDEGRAYTVNPFQRLADAAPDLVVAINASPSNVGKREQRHALFAAASGRHQLPLVFVNQIGGHDQLVFDGASFVVTPEEGVVFEARRFEEDVVTLSFADGRFGAADGASLATPPMEGLSRMAFYRSQIVLGLRDYARRSGFSRALVGSSGGIDSALTLALAVEALGAENVVGITMPSRFSSAGSVDDSVDLCRNLGIRLIEHSIRDIVVQYEAGFADACGEPLAGLARENLQARIRGTILMEFSNAFGNLLLTTGNKSEISVGYCTLYGDTNGGLGPIGDLYKTEVFDLCRHINTEAGRELIPQAIIDKEPSAELASNQQDSDSLPPYPVLDLILKQLIEGERLGAEEREATRQAYAELLTTPEGPALVARVKRLIWRNEYKRRQAPPILRLRARAFGSGRQMPIAAKYDY
ncbi:MAG: NAD+ synthase [Candidatus Dactylopiibacterium carminicum]|uniref:Glutamine-dependent NAD(+) synthetase n=1 Tax=Candidatus Dactylopiibacterium carminicum TaxID=857335 RepID=A0A272ESJ6_9RHOO|nr:NAD+ synthase [Candidatus Dactylopiibacterium carminicum]KAF7599056.1 NAD+ synthase [Candidatus Dactylopiibacterium carminicum]PAS93093.1 MAG: NAD+ synthase [Candidatus Dactylopiibacterium carminicum]PAS96658.1 MAG: NAD+ synthase [Candidatus Dactylopiibacterium carminicum]PAS99069.1 MAG: NAD+ synthase [Candidatus Dactylopiibacterium carminicum]